MIEEGFQNVNVTLTYKEKANRFIYLIEFEHTDTDTPHYLKIITDTQFHIKIMVFNQEF